MYLPQNPQTVFTEITVYDELLEVFKSHRDLYEGAQFVDNNIKEMLEKMELSEKKDSHPFDLSVGQQQRWHASQSFWYLMSRQRELTGSLRKSLP